MQGAGIEPGAPSAMDGDLLARARGGDLAAFEAIAVQRLPGLYRLARAILGGDAEAAEATCNTLVGAWHELPHLDDPARFDAWLDRILVSECRMDLERAGQREDRAAECRPRRPMRRASAPVAPDELDRDAIVRLLDGAFESLDAVDRAVLVLHDLGRPVACGHRRHASHAARDRQVAAARGAPGAPGGPRGSGMTSPDRTDELILEMLGRRAGGEPPADLAGRTLLALAAAPSRRGVEPPAGRASRAAAAGCCWRPRSSWQSRRSSSRCSQLGR